MTDKLKNKFDDYANYHRHPKNCYSHYVGIPLIAISSLGFISLIHPLVLYVVVLMTILFYVAQDKKWGLLFSPVVLLMAFAGAYLSNHSVYILVGMQIIGWISQYIGHLIYEKKSPAFYKNSEHLLIGPIWIFSKLVKIR